MQIYIAAFCQITCSFSLLAFVFVVIEFQFYPKQCEKYEMINFAPQPLDGVNLRASSGAVLHFLCSMRGTSITLR